MKTEQILEQNTLEIKATLDRLYFESIAKEDRKEQGVIVNAKLIDRDKSFIGTRLLVVA